MNLSQPGVTVRLPLVPPPAGFYKDAKMRTGKLFDARKLIKGLPSEVRTQYTIYDERDNICGFLCNFTKVTPSCLPTAQVREALGEGFWRAFPDSHKGEKSGDYTFWLTIHRHDVPRADLEGVFKP
jgi:hypothetical protein